MKTNDSGLKRCPGFGPQEVHELPADLEHFNKSGTTAEGEQKLSLRCRACGNAYLRLWAEAKRKGLPTDRVSLEAAAAAGTLTARAGWRPAGASSEPVSAPAMPLASATEMAPGWTTTTVAGEAYPLPEANGAVESPEGQAALEALKVAKRRRNTEAKRAQRARERAAKAAE